MSAAIVRTSSSAGIKRQRPKPEDDDDTTTMISTAPTLTTALRNKTPDGSSTNNTAARLMVGSNWVVHWILPTVAQIQLVLPNNHHASTTTGTTLATICVQGCGRIVNRSSTQSVQILGVTLRPSHSIEFDSPWWSSWVTFELTADHDIQITNLEAPDETDNDRPTFFLYDAVHDSAEARPTWILPTWKSAVDAIWKDYDCNHSNDDDVDDDDNSSNMLQQQQPQQQQPSLASYYQQDSLGWTEDQDDGDTPENIRQNPLSFNNSNATQNDNTTNHGFIIAVCGAKGVGKSTLVRYCWNRFLSSSHPTTIAVLDADPGQPEWCVPGMLQLTLLHRPTLWPPHRQVVVETDHHHDQNSTVVQSHYFGSVTSATDPTLYIQCITSLVQAYRNLVLEEECNKNSHNPSPIPLLVNLDGWVQGLGLQIWTTLVQDILQPQHVIQIVGDSASKQMAPLSVLENSNIQCHWHRCWAYNSQQAWHDTNNGNIVNHLNQVDARKDEPTTTKDASATHDSQQHHDGSEPTKTTIQQQQQRQQQQPPVSRSSSLATYDNNDNDDEDDDDEATDMPVPMIPPDGAATTTVARGTVPAATAWPATVFRQIRLVSYFMQPAIIGNHHSNHRLWDSCRPAYFGIDDPDNIIAEALAAARPYVVSVDEVRMVSTATSAVTTASSATTGTTDRQWWNLWNASLVGLCVDDRRDDTPTPAALLPCLGLGLIRAVDRVRRLLYILTPCDDLSSVNVLTMGTNVELPLVCYFRGVQAEAFPHQSFVDAAEAGNNHNSTTNNSNWEIIGADPIKSRNNIARRAGSKR